MLANWLLLLKKIIMIAIANVFINLFFFYFSRFTEICIQINFRFKYMHTYIYIWSCVCLNILFRYTKFTESEHDFCIYQFKHQVKNIFHHIPIIQIIPFHFKKQLIFSRHHHSSIELIQMSGEGGRLNLFLFFV